MKKILFFYTEWCNHCKKMVGPMKKLAEVGYNIELIDADSNSELADSYDIKRIPTFIVEDKGFEIDRMIGSADVTEIIQKFRGN